MGPRSLWEAQLAARANNTQKSRLAQPQSLLRGGVAAQSFIMAPTQHMIAKSAAEHELGQLWGGLQETDVGVCPF